MTGPCRKREPLVQGPFKRASGEDYWICRVDSRRRIRIPEAICAAQGWRVGDRLELEILDTETGIALHVINVDAMARK